MFYLIFCSFAPDNGNIPTTVIVILKVAIILLPILWLLGILSPIDCFFLWLFEQAYIFLFGGSGAATNLRLIIQLLMSVILSMVHFVPSDLAILILLAIFGYFFSSFDLIYLIECLIARMKSKRKVSATKGDDTLTSNQGSQQNLINDVSSTSLSSTTTKSVDGARASDKLSFKWFDWSFGYFMFLMALVASILPFCLTYYLETTSDSKFQAQQILLYIGLGLFVLSKMLGDIQSVYVFFGLIRNPLYPKSALSGANEKKRKKKSAHSIKDDRILFKVCRYGRVFIIKVLSPLVLCAIVSLDCSANKIYNDKSLSYWRIICVLRAFRWVIFLFLYLSLSLF